MLAKFADTNNSKFSQHYTTNDLTLQIMGNSVIKTCQVSIWRRTEEDDFRLSNDLTREMLTETGVADCRHHGLQTLSNTM